MNSSSPHIPNETRKKDTRSVPEYGIRDLIYEYEAKLRKVNEKLAVKESGVKAKLKFQSKKLRKGKEKALETYNEQMRGSERKAEAEKAALQTKLAAVQKAAEADAKAYRDRMDTLENRIMQVDKEFNKLVITHYHPCINRLYESEDELSADDISLPLSYHELAGQKAELESNIQRLKQTLQDEADKEEAKLKAKFEESKMVEHKPKKVIKMKKTVAEPEEQKDEEEVTESEEFKEFKRREADERHKKHIAKEETYARDLSIEMPCKSDPFWTVEARANLDSLEMKHIPDRYAYVYMKRQDKIEMLQAERERKEKEEAYLANMRAVRFQEKQRDNKYGDILE